MTLHIELNKIQNIYNTFRKYYSYKTKLEKYLSSNQIYLIMKRNDNDDNYNKLILSIKKRSKSLFLPMINQFYKLMCLLKASSNTFKFFKTVNLDNLKKILKENNNYDYHDQLLNEYFTISYKYRKHISHRFLNEDIFIFNVKGLKYKYYNKTNAEFKNRNCFDNNCRNKENFEKIIREAAKYKLDFYMENDIKKRNIILNNFFISPVFKDYYLCIYNNCYNDFLLSLKTSVIYQYTIYCLKMDCKNKIKYENKYDSLISLFKSSNYTFDEFADLIKSYWKFLNLILI